MKIVGCEMNNKFLFRSISRWNHSTSVFTFLFLGVVFNCFGMKAKNNDDIIDGLNCLEVSNVVKESKDLLVSALKERATDLGCSKDFIASGVADILIAINKAQAVDGIIPFISQVDLIHSSDDEKSDITKMAYFLCDFLGLWIKNKNHSVDGIIPPTLKLDSGKITYSDLIGKLKELPVGDFLHFEAGVMSLANGIEGLDPKIFVGKANAKNLVFKALVDLTDCMVDLRKNNNEKKNKEFVQLEEIKKIDSLSKEIKKLMSDFLSKCDRYIVFAKKESMQSVALEWLSKDVVPYATSLEKAVDSARKSNDLDKLSRMNRWLKTVDTELTDMFKSLNGSVTDKSGTDKSVTDKSGIIPQI